MRENNKFLSPRSQRISLVVAGFGQGMVLTFVTTFLLVYLVEYAKISSAGMAIVTLILTFSRVFDALNDPIMGGLVDTTRTRFGKMRPYILISALPVALLSALLFSLPVQASEFARITLFGIFYLLWGIAYTMCDVPYWSLIGAAFSDIEERNRTISHVRAGMSIATGLITLGGPWLARALSFDAKANARGWSLAAAFICLVGMSLFTRAFFGTREKCDVREKKSVSLKMLLAVLFRNKALFLVLLGSILGFGRLLIQTGGAVFAVIAYRDEGFFTLIGAAIIIGMIIAAFMATPLIRRFGGKKLIVASSLFGAVFNVAMYAAGFKLIPVMMALIFANGLSLGIFMVVQTTMIADAVDYIERRTGVRNDGISFSSLTFVSKMMGSLAVMVFGFVLAATGYQSGVEVTASMQDGVFRAITLIPALSCALSAVPFALYTIDDKPRA